MLDLCLESIRFLEKVREKVTMSSFPKKKSTSLTEKKLETSEKVTTSEEDEKGMNPLNDIEETVHTIHKNDLNNFQGQST